MLRKLLNWLNHPPPEPMATVSCKYQLTEDQLNAIETGLLFSAAHWRSRMYSGTLTPRDIELRREWANMYQEAITLEQVIETLHGEHGTLDLCKVS